MTHEAFLNGRVTRQRLGLFAPPMGPETPPLKRLALPQGELAQIHDDAEGMRYLAVMELRQGTTRGNHVHQRKVEHVYIIAGEVDLVVSAEEGGVADSVVLAPGDLAVIQPGVAHALCVKQSGWGIEFSPGRFDPADATRVQLI